MWKSSFRPSHLLPVTESNMVTVMEGEGKTPSAWLGGWGVGGGERFFQNVGQQRRQMTGKNHVLEQLNPEVDYRMLHFTSLSDILLPPGRCRNQANKSPQCWTDAAWHFVKGGGGGGEKRDGDGA